MMRRIISICTCCILLLSFSFQLPGQEKKQRKERNHWFEISVGVGRSNPQALYYRARGIDDMVGQYVDYYGGSADITGEFKENKLMIPLSVSVNFPLKKKWYLRGGIEYGMSSSISGKQFEILWQPMPGDTIGAGETQEYELSYKTYYIMPRLGLGCRVSDSFDLYGSVGLGFTRFRYTEDFTVRVGALVGQSGSRVFKAGGTVPGFIVGGKYRFPLGKKGAEKKVHGFVKVEFMMLKVNSLKGSKSFDPGGTVAGELQDAVFYRYEWNPFGPGWFDYWDAFETDPAGADKRNIQKMGLNLSSIRLMIGISF